MEYTQLKSYSNKHSCHSSSIIDESPKGLAREHRSEGLIDGLFVCGLDTGHVLLDKLERSALHMWIKTMQQ